MFESLLVIARENPAVAATSGNADPEDKEALNFHILLIENMNHFVEETDTRMETLASGMRDALRPKRFVGVYKKEDRTREVDMAYGANGAIDAFTLKKRGSVRIGAVPTGLAEDTLDPIAAFLRARSWLDQATVGSELGMSVFDGYYYAVDRSNLVVAPSILAVAIPRALGLLLDPGQASLALTHCTIVLLVFRTASNLGPDLARRITLDGLLMYHALRRTLDLALSDKQLSIGSHQFVPGRNFIRFALHIAHDTSARSRLGTRAGRPAKLTSIIAAASTALSFLSADRSDISGRARQRSDVLNGALRLLLLLVDASESGAQLGFGFGLGLGSNLCVLCVHLVP